MVPHCEEGTRRIYYTSYVREQAILFFTHRTEKEEKKKTAVCKEQIIGPAHMRFVDRKKKEKERQSEKKKEKQRPNFIHSFIEEKTEIHKKQKISRFSCGIFWVIFFSLPI
jgi:hypothetical protein